MNLRSLLYSTALLFLPVTLSAAEKEVTLLTLHMTDGTTEMFNLPDKPVMTFTEDRLDVKSTTMQGSYPRKDVDYFDFTKGAPVSALEAIESGASLVVTYIDKTTLTVAAPDLKKVSVTDLNGRVLAIVPSDADGIATLDITNLPEGVYVVVPAPGHAFKIAK